MYVWPKSLISAEAKKSPIRDVLNYLNDMIQYFIAYFYKYDWCCYFATLIKILVQKSGQVTKPIILEKYACMSFR